jgi:PIN domain nuclease of toxin-antitoxin system
MGRRLMIVLDTSALLLWTLDPTQVPETAKSEIGASERIVVSSISIWEIALKVKRGKLEIPIRVRDYVDRLEKVERLEIVSMDIQTWLDNVDLDWEHRDPADRTIVSLARRLDCPLISSDRVIREYYPKTVW